MENTGSSTTPHSGGRGDGSRYGRGRGHWRTHRNGHNAGIKTSCPVAEPRVHLTEAQLNCFRTAFNPSFRENTRVRERATCVTLAGREFLIAERTVAGCDADVYQRNRRIWECVPRGDVHVFLADQTTYHHVASLQGLRKFGYADTPYGPSREKSLSHPPPPSSNCHSASNSNDATNQTRTPTTTTPTEAVEGTNASLNASVHSNPRLSSTPASPVASVVMMEMIDGECGHLAAFTLADGGRYWIIGGRASHVVVRLDVPEEDLTAHPMCGGAHANPPNQRENPNGGGVSPNAALVEKGSETEGASTLKSFTMRRAEIASRIARVWRATLSALPAEKVLALHEHLTSQTLTACFDAILTDTGHFVDYGPEESLRFYALTRPGDSSTRGLCVAPHDPSVGLPLLASFGLAVVPHHAAIPREEAEQRSRFAERLDCRGGVAYGLNRDGAVVRMWRRPSHPYAMERAAQEAIVTHNLSGHALRAQLVKKLGRLPREVRAGLGKWEAERLPSLVQLAAWLHLQQHLQPTTNLAKLQEVRQRWISLQRACGAITPQERDKLATYEPTKQPHPTRSPDVIVCSGPQGCGKSTFARALSALLTQARQSACWMNQDELGGRRDAFIKAVRNVTKRPDLFSYVIVDKMNLDDAERADYTAMNLNTLTVAWTHPDGAAALVDVCLDRIRKRGNAHRTFVPTLDKHTGGADDTTPTDTNTTTTTATTKEASVATPHAGGKGRRDALDTHRMRGILQRSARRYRSPSDGVFVEVNVSNSTESILRTVWALLQLHSVADLPDVDTLNMSAAMKASAKHEAYLRGPQRKVQYGAIQIENPDEVVALVPPHLLKNKRVQSAFHVTTKFFGGEEDRVMLPKLIQLEGESIDLTLTRIVSDSMGTAIVVRNNNEFPCANAQPHITVGNAPGIPPKYSNELLDPSREGYRDRTDLPLPNGTTVRGKFAFIYR